MFYNIRILKNFAKFTGKHLCWSLFHLKRQILRPATLLIKRKKRLRRKSFPVNFTKFLKASFLQNISGRLFLILVLNDFFVCLFYQWFTQISNWNLFKYEKYPFYLVVGGFLTSYVWYSLFESLKVASRIRVTCWKEQNLHFFSVFLNRFEKHWILY